MEELKRFYEDGFIAEGTYRHSAVKAALQTLDKLDYKVFKLLGRGALGSVFEVKSPHSKSSIAIKVVLEHRVSKNELEVWPTLRHPNLLQLNESNYFSDAYTYIFITEICPVALNKHFNQLNFLLDNSAFQRSISWLKGILTGLNYLHSKSLCHLDLKPDNILITKEDIAVITDFGFVSSTSDFTSRYGSPLIYRPPECSTDEHRAKVDGSKYDMWTVGLLALEMFTKESLLKEADNWKILPDDYWPEKIYPTIFHILQKNQLSKLMDKAFPSSNVFEEDVANVSNIIKSLLNLNPEIRPSSKEALQRRLFGGNVFDAEEEYVWTHLASVFDVKALLSMFRILELNRRPKITLNFSKIKTTPETKSSSESQKNSIIISVISEVSTEKSNAKTNIEYEKFVDDIEGEKMSDTSKKEGNRKQKFVAWLRKKISVLSTACNCIRRKKK